MYDICMIDHINISEEESLLNNMMQVEKTKNRTMQETVVAVRGQLPLNCLYTE